MAARVERAGDRLSEHQPNTEGTVQLRMHTISSAMEQLRLRRGGYNGQSTDTESTVSRGGSVGSEVRNWLQGVEKRLAEHEERLHHGMHLTKLLADQQVLQLEIQSEGQAHIARLELLLRGDPLLSPNSDCGAADRRQISVDSLKKRWLAAYLNSLSLQIRIEEAVPGDTEGCESDTDPIFAAPPHKRARRTSAWNLESEAEEENDDTFPFAASEYESIMDAPTTQSSSQVDSASDAEQTRGTKKWGSTQKDIGYSSGENSIPEALNKMAEIQEEQSVRRRIDCSPCKAFYRTVPLESDLSECEIIKATNDKLLPEEALLSDSMIVNYDALNNTAQQNDFDDVLKLMDDECEMGDSFHTEWREIRADAQRRRSRTDRQFIFGSFLDKASCDASSEDSSDLDGLKENDDQLLENHSPMNRSMISNITLESTPVQYGSLKRVRGQRPGKKTSSLLLETTEMDASFCSTRSELVPGRQINNMRMRKKLKIRRLPRSMSDGEQLGFGCNPTVRISPPRTPVSRSTRLLQRLDDALCHPDSDTTAPEQSDAAAYEWDDYRPPNKDDSELIGLSDFHNSSMAVDEMLRQDDDYNRHFGGSHQMLTRLINESRANLLIVAKSLEAVDDPQVMRDIELIARTNIRQLDTAVKINGLGHTAEVRELADLRVEWELLLERVGAPLPAILAKFEKFTASLRALDQTSSMNSLNGVSTIHSREDVAKALASMLLIQENLRHDRDELKELLVAPSFKPLLAEHEVEVEAISDDFDEAIAKISGLVASLKQLNMEWGQWNEEQDAIRNIMQRIEGHIARGSVEPSTVSEEIRLCQERMDSLETMCNYLTASLTALQAEAESETIVKPLPDFNGEIRLYSNALEQLKSRFEVSKIPAVPAVRERKVATVATQAEEPAVAPPRRRSAKLQIGLLLAGLLASVVAFYLTFIHGSTFGPHLTYTRGPPPV
ncbi:unnamed protein product, partial [Mesorhabditis spiculigera]